MSSSPTSVILCFSQFSTKIKSAEHCQNLFAHHFWNSKQVSITCWQLCSHGVGLFKINKDLAIIQNFVIPFPYQHLRNQSLSWFRRKMHIYVCYSNPISPITSLTRQSCSCLCCVLWRILLCDCCYVIAQLPHFHSIKSYFEYDTFFTKKTESIKVEHLNVARQA